MFVPPDQRSAGPPGEPPPPQRRMTSGELTVLMCLIGVLLVAIVLAPIGGSTILQLWTLLRR